LATRHDIVAYLRQDVDARLATGWRLDLIGEQLDDLLQGKAGLSFDGKGGLKMISAMPNQ
jgi:ribonuclease D